MTRPLSRRGGMAAFVVAAALSLIVPMGCSSPTEPEPAALPDAGDEAFLRRVIPLMWGRKPASIREVRVLADIMSTVGRAETVRLMARMPEFYDHWTVMVKDILGVYRIGDPTNVDCYGVRNLDGDDPRLAEWVRDNPPTAGHYMVPFTMVDLIHSALVLGDLSPVYRANLFAQLQKDYNLPNKEAGRAARHAKAEIFMRGWLGRREECLSCHNSEWSVSGSDDPALDRTWEIPGLFEKAVFGSSAGRDVADLRPFFRRFGVVAGAYYDGVGPEGDELEAEIASAEVPWGMHEACGRFRRPGDVWEDDLDDDAFLVSEYPKDASVWDLESQLDASFFALRDGLQVADDLTVGPDDALGWLMATNLTDRIWLEVYGHRLTIANYFPRNRAQRDTLDTMTRVFVDSGYSLTELLVAMTTAPWFNRPVPAAGQEDALPFADLFDPWKDDSIAPDERRNGLADLVHRWPARILLGSVNFALGWYPPEEFPSHYLSEDALLQRQIGVYLKDGDPGFRGVSFQSQLAWEDAFGACEDRGVCPIIELATDSPVSADDRCQLCLSRDTICELDDRCCTIEWDGWCPDDCSTLDPEFDLGFWLAPPTEANWIVRLVAAAQNANVSLGEAVAAMKDRLLTDPIIDSDEQQVLEVVLEAPFDTPAATDDGLEARLRRACSLLLATPQFALSGNPGPDRLETAFDGFEGPSMGYQQACERIRSVLGDALTCHEQSLELRL